MSLSPQRRGDGHSPSAYVNFGPPPGPGLCEMYSGPSFLFSFACIVAIFRALSSDISMSDASEKKDCCVPKLLLVDPCIEGAKDMGP